MSHGKLSKWKTVYKRQIDFLEVYLQESYDSDQLYNFIFQFLK